MPSNQEHGPAPVATTLSDQVFRFTVPGLRRELEAFRVRYESEFGETDLTKRYTSTWPTAEQAWMLENEPLRYWNGLPPFVQAFIREKMTVAHRGGNLDDMPAAYLRLYLTGKLNINEQGPGR